MTLDQAKNVADIVVAITISAGAIAAAIKYQMFRIFSHRWESDLVCRDRILASGQVLFVAEYTVQNRGQRPLRLRSIDLKVMRSRLTEGTRLLRPDHDGVISQRRVPDEVGNSGNLDVQPGERSIFTLRCLLPDLPDVVFVECLLSLPHRRRPALFVGLHARQSKGRGPGGASAASEGAFPAA